MTRKLQPRKSITSVCGLLLIKRSYYRERVNKGSLSAFYWHLIIYCGGEAINIEIMKTVVHTLINYFIGPLYYNYMACIHTIRALPFEGFNEPSSLLLRPEHVELWDLKGKDFSIKSNLRSLDLVLGMKSNLNVVSLS